jgi:hypothetical protein
VMIAVFPSSRILSSLTYLFPHSSPFPWFILTFDF